MPAFFCFATKWERPLHSPHAFRLQIRTATDEFPHLTPLSKATSIGVLLALYIRLYGLILTSYRPTFKDGCARVNTDP